MLSNLCKRVIPFFLMVFLIAGCRSNPDGAAIPQAGLPQPTATTQEPAPTLDMSNYAFPESVDIDKRYLFYLHGKIVEDQGIPAISPDYGEYEYKAILEKLSSYGFVVISEQRGINTDSTEYAKRVSGQISTLIASGVPAKNITVIGASKGGGIAILISHLLANQDLNFVILAICSPETVAELEHNQIFLYGNVLSIYDSSDNLAGSCEDLFSYSEGEGLSRHEEIILSVGTGHGIIFKPLEDWILPAVQWAEKP